MSTNDTPVRRPDVIYHITESAAWPPPGGDLKPQSLADEGFIHASAWGQLPGVASSLFAGRTDLVVLEIDTTLLETTPVWEDLYDIGQPYPHIYGPLAESAVTGILEVTWDETSTPWFRARGLPANSSDMSISWRSADASDRETVSLLARLNSQLIEDEGADNTSSRTELTTRMAGFLTGQYDAWILDVGTPVACDAAGYALVNRTAEPPYLRQFFISRGLRRLGVGTRAFAGLRETLGTDSLSLDVLSTNERGRRFWHSLGFTDRSIRMVHGAASDGPGATRKPAR